MIILRKILFGLFLVLTAFLAVNTTGKIKIGENPLFGAPTHEPGV